jgi:hypothetical protein
MTASTQPTYCIPDPIDELTFAQLHIAAVRTNIHVHEGVPCQRCLQDVAYLGQHGFALTTMIHRLREQIYDLEHPAPAALAVAVAPNSPCYVEGDEVTVTITDVHVDGIGDHRTWLACAGVAEGIELPFVDDDGKPLPNVRIERAGGA